MVRDVRELIFREFGWIARGSNIYFDKTTLRKVTNFIVTRMMPVLSCWQGGRRYISDTPTDII